MLMEIVLGSLMLVVALTMGTKFYGWRLGLKRLTPPIEPSWIPRLFFIGIGLLGLIYLFLARSYHPWLRHLR